MRELLRLHRDVKGSSLYVEQALERIAEMSHVMGGGTTADALVNQVWRLFAERSPDLGLWCLLDDGRVVGHLLVILNLWDGEPVGWVTQCALDSGVAHLGEWGAKGLREMEAWVARVNAAYAGKLHVKGFMMTSFRHSRAWARHFGFEEYRTLYRRPVGAA